MLSQIITDFRGLGNPYKFGDPQRTRTMTNMYTRDGRVVCRGGYTNVITATTDAIIGLGTLEQDAQTTPDQHIVAITTGDIYGSTNGTSWSDINSTAFISTPDATDVADFFDTGSNLIMAMRTMKYRYYSGSGNVTNNANAPSGRVICLFEGYTLMGYTEPSTNGTVANQDPSTIRYTTAPTGTWATSSSTFGSVTNSEIYRMLIQGRTNFIYKPDCLVAMRFVGGTTIMSILRVPFALGLLAKRAVGQTSVGDIFPASDGRLYINAAGEVKPLREEVSATLRKNSSSQDLSGAVSLVNEELSFYSLFYPDSSGNMTRRLNFNYLTGEFSDFVYTGATVKHAVYSNILNASGILGTEYADFSADKVLYKLQTGILDGSSGISYAYHTDWQFVRTRALKELRVVVIRAKGKAGARLKVSVATDYSTDYTKSVTLDLVPSPSGAEIEAVYRPGVSGTLFDIKVEPLPYSANDDTDIRAIELWADPKGSIEFPAPTARELSQAA